MNYQGKSLKLSLDFKMNIYIFYITIISLIIIPSTVLAAEQIAPKFEIKYQKEGPHGLINNIEIISTQKKTLIDISSEFGIGAVSVKLIEGFWPETIITRLHLKGLEGFSVSNGTRTLQKSDLSVKAYDEDGNLVEKRYLQDDEYYEIKLPSSLFIYGINKITINWIDFYR